MNAETSAVTKAAFDVLVYQIRELTNERDEARRLHCHMSAQFLYKSVELDTAKHVAKNKGWDCYEERKI